MENVNNTMNTDNTENNKNIIKDKIKNLAHQYGLFVQLIEELLLV